MNFTKQIFTKRLLVNVSAYLHQTNNAKVSQKNQISINFLSTIRTTQPVVNLQRNKIFNFTKRNLIGKQSSILPIQRLSNSMSTIQAKKRPIRKKRIDETNANDDGDFNVMAFATAEVYDLERLLTGIVKQELYEPKKFIYSDNNGVEPDVLYVSAKYQVGVEPRDIFFFREGTVILWNITELESSNVLSFLRQYEQDSYDDTVVLGESELMSYNYAAEDTKAHLKRGKFYLSKKDECYLEKYTFSNAMSLSVKLGIWEASLDKYIDSIAFVTEDLKRGTKIRMSRAEALRKTGELFALRHLINLSSDLLDTPDFYWDREELETLYAQTCSYFSIPRRTKVVNEKLNHCVELAELISSNLNDIHHVRLEWMIIILIMVEVVFEITHYIDRYVDAGHGLVNSVG